MAMQSQGLGLGAQGSEPGWAAGLIELSLLPLAAVRKKWVREIQGNRGRGFGE